MAPEFSYSLAADGIERVEASWPNFDAPNSMQRPRSCVDRKVRLRVAAGFGQHLAQLRLRLRRLAARELPLDTLSGVTATSFRAVDN